MEKLLVPKCHICQETNYRALYCDEVYKAKAPKSQKTILDIIRHISRVLKVQFNVPARARVCAVCYKELVRYDCYVVELLEVQKRLSEKINARIKDKLAKSAARKNRSADNFMDDDDEHFDFSDDDDDIIEEDDDDDADGEDDGQNEVVDHDDEDNDHHQNNDDDDNDIHFDEDNDLFVKSEVVETSEEPTAGGGDEVQEQVASSGATDREIKQENYPCPVCNIKLKNKRALEYHLKKDHKNRVTCTVCGLQVRNDEYLVLHMNLHNGKTENDCAFCDKTYARRVNVIRHMQVHFNKKQHQCERCGMVFMQTTIFYNHRLQHEAEDNPLICSVCGQSFRTKRTYKRHLVTHQEDRPRYNCEYCGKVFVDKYTLKMHIRSHHTNTTTGDESQENPAPVQKKQKTTNATTAEDPEHLLFTCVICQHIFLRKDLFDDHMQNVHDVIMDT